MLPHRARLAVIIATLIVGVLLTIAAREGVAPELVETLRPHALELVTALTLLVLGVGAVDAGVVERRRRNPKVSAVSDDVVLDPVDQAELRAARSVIGEAMLKRELKRARDDETPS